MDEACPSNITCMWNSRVYERYMNIYRLLFHYTLEYVPVHEFSFKNHISSDVQDLACTATSSILRNAASFPEISREFSNHVVPQICTALLEKARVNLNSFSMRVSSTYRERN